MDDQRAKEARAAELAAQVADLLNEIQNLGAGPVMATPGQVRIPGGIIRPVAGTWEVSA
ncbi:hypothetical protein ACIRIR_35945 [Streptomyces globisporus]|uniref:hypothetical protein n=1 Tax=Streptomyces globisporus TaxID=1908 RepID=UPI00381986A3